MMRRRKAEKPQWELEAPFDQPASLDELLEAPPFTEAGGGDSITAGTRIPRWLFRRVAKLCETEGIPYEIASDVYRDAIYLGLRIIHMRYKTARDWSIETKMASIVSDAGIMRRIRKQVDDLASGLGNLIREDEIEKAAEKLEEYVSAAIELEDDWVRARLFKMLREDKTIHDTALHCSKEVQKLIKETDVRLREEDNADSK